MLVILFITTLSLLLTQTVSDGGPCVCTSEYMNCAGKKKSTINLSEMCPNVEKAFLSDNLFTTFPDGFQERFTNIDASFNKLTSLPSAAKFSSRIRILDLRSNEIASTSTEFQTLSALEELKLNGNQLTTLRFLPDPCNLRKFEVNLNSISTLEGPLLKCAKLELLDLTGNKLTNLPAASFMGLTKLNDLELRNNPLKSLTLGTFQGLPELDTLLLSDSQLTSVPGGIFDGLTKLTYLTLSDNPLKTLPLTLFAGLISLEKLFLDSIQLESIPANIFHGLRRLQILHLDDNKLTTLPPGLFTGLENLEIVMLNRNQILEIPTGVFTHLPSMKKIFLSDNRLTHLTNLMECCPQIRIASFDNNNIQEPSEVVMKRYLADEDHQVRLTLNENPILASSLKWVLHDAELQRDVDDDDCACGSLRKFRAFALLCVATPCGPGESHANWVAAVRAAGSPGA